MKPSPTYLFDMDDPGSTVGMDVDDADPLDILSGAVSDNRLADADFFNSFQDDFDDSDIN
ncbi:small acidic protein 1-like [Magnolia sinica]|uniref:small acidic protein 1-like n=1 Tax=Magnolia sinica TaxID=86752 RepID=UPI00265899C2|nr:small acidic protein 1-like [Magnolia sinica]